MPWRRKLIPAVALALAWATPLPADTPTTLPTTNPTTQPADEADAGDDNAPATIQAPSIASVVKLSMSNHILSMSSDLPALQRETRVAIADFPGKTIAVIDRTSQATPVISIRHEIWAPPNKSMIYTFSSLQNDVRLAVDSEDAHELRSVQFIQASPTGGADPEEPAIKLYVSVRAIDSNNIKPVTLKLVADDVVQLRRKYPRETVEYLQPMLAAIRQEAAVFGIDHREAWQVLQKHLQVDPKVADQVKKLLADLDAEEYATREAASEALDKLGEPGALAVMRMSRTSLTPEQHSRLDAFIAKYKPFSEADATRYAADVPFLLDCLYTDDQPMRTLAIKQLKEQTARPIDLPTDATPSQWLIAVRRLQKQLIAGPTTQMSQAQP